MPFLQFQHIPVGDNLAWQPYYPKIMQIERTLERITDPKVVDCGHRLVKRMQTLLITGNVPFVRIDVERSDEWSFLSGRREDDDICETSLWLEELLNDL